MRWVFLTLAFWLVLSLTKAEAAGYLPTTSTVSGKLILGKESTVVLRTWPGKAICKQGQLVLVSPELKLIYSSPSNKPKDKGKTPGTEKNAEQILLHNYGAGIQNVEIGPYPAGTEIILGISTPGFCKTSRVSTNPSHARIRHNGGESWTISWEDYTDRDFNDVYTEVTFVPTNTDQLGNRIIGKRAFAEEPVYKLPWPAGISHKFTVLPGVGEHKTTRAYDIDMTKGDTIVASEMGMVLWIEDSFGAGSCSSNLRDQTNVIVIQTSKDVNLTYVHLLQDSALVKVGDIVQQGQPIAQAGNSGFVCSSTGDGSHLHIEWQHQCYSLEQAQKRRELKESKVGVPTFAWSCPNFPPDALFGFTIDGKQPKIPTGKLITSDNKVE